MSATVNAAVVNWKTTVAGIAFGLAVFAAQAYKSGMTPKQWAVAIGSGVLAALPGILAHDGVAPGQ